MRSKMTEPRRENMPLTGQESPRRSLRRPNLDGRFAAAEVFPIGSVLSATSVGRTHVAVEFIAKQVKAPPRVLRNCSRAPYGSSQSWKFERARTPKGHQDSARGFNPWNRPHRTAPCRGTRSICSGTYQESVMANVFTTSFDERTSSRFKGGNTPRFAGALSGRAAGGE
jgi:hypothetical protein